MKKLSKAQQEVLDKANEAIRFAKEHDYPEWLMLKYYNWTDCREERREELRAYYEPRWKKALEKNDMKKYWEQERNNIVLTHCSSTTLKALEKAGEIEIIKDSCGDRYYGIDTVKILNPKF